MLKRFLLSISGLLISVCVLSQNHIPPVDPKMFIKQTTPTNPDVASLGQYAMAPPSLSTGMPTQEIPLFELKENGLSFPINLYYSYGGFKLKQEASSIGLGWILTENTITRIVKHIPDEHLNLMKKFEEFGDNLVEEIGVGDITGGSCHDNFRTTNYSYTNSRIFYKLYDAQPDIYIYNVGGYKGKFFWLNNSAIQLEHNDVKISGQQVQDMKILFTLITPDGIQYQFREADRTYQAVAPVIRPTMCAGANQIETYIDYGNTTCWRLSEIKNLTTQSTITINYNSQFITQDKNINQTTTLTFSAPLNQEGEFRITNYGKDEVAYRTINEIYYSHEIVSDNFKVLFLTNTRSDAGQSRIEEIQIYNKSDLTNPFKTIKFTQEYFGNISNPESCYLKLKRVKIQGGGSDLEYEFSYLHETLFTSGELNREGLSIDHWGYWNGSSNSTLIPFTAYIQAQIQYESNLTPAIIPWANRDPSFFYAKSFALEKVEYPTGGFSKISYESANGKGIRVASIEDNDGHHSILKYYNYGLPFTEQAFYYYDEYYTDQCCGIHPDYPQYPRQVKTITHGSTPIGPSGFFAELGDRFYETVTEYIGTPDGQGGRNVYKFFSAPAYGIEATLSETIRYKYGSTDFVEKVTNNYSLTILKTIPFWRIPELTWTGVPTGPCLILSNQSNSCCPQDPEKGYILSVATGGTDQVSAVWMHLDNTVTIKDGVLTTKTFYYRGVEASTGLPKDVQVINTVEQLSDGRSKQTFVFYAGDADPDNSQIILGLPQMWDISNSDFKNYIAPVIKSKTLIGTKLISKETNIYSYESSTGNLLQTGYEFFPTGVETSKVIWTYTFDAKANLLTARKDNNIENAFIWGYNGQFVTSQVISATPDQKAYTSFENNSSGGWNGIISANITLGGVTGVKHYTANNLSLTLDGLQATSNYTVTYWSKNGAYQVQGTQSGWPKSYKTINLDGDNWTLYEHIISGVNSTSVSGTGAIDELRLYPRNARMTTYTYDPLIGMTSQSDFNCRIIYYQYDVFGRLKRIKDEDGNILKEYTYKYKEQQ